MEVDKNDQAEVNSDPAVEKVEGEPSNKGKEVVEETTKDPIEVTSEEIFPGCNSFEKV